MRFEPHPSGTQKVHVGQSARPAFYIPQLDGLRFLAFFLVFLSHNLPTGGRVGQHLGPDVQRAFSIIRDTAGFGLSLFFFLSAYLITSLLLLERKVSGTIDLRSFYLRRVLRIWPLYFSFLGAVAVVGLWRPANHISFVRFAAMSTLTGNWYSIVAGIGPFVIGPLWSISIEEQFYAIWPGVFSRLSHKAFIWFCTSLGVISLLCTAGFTYGGASSLGLWLNSLTEFIFFAADGMVALFFGAMRKPHLLYCFLMMAAGCVLWLEVEVGFGINDRTLSPMPLKAPLGYLAIAIGCALLLMGSLHFPAGSVPQWLVYLGKISYGLYVFHALAMHLVWSIPPTWHLRAPGIDLVSVFVITLMLAALSYRYLERPFLQLKRRFESVNTRPL
jgi:peptidoglycan/LPS O-acetylase OafA/YrhL